MIPVQVPITGKEKSGDLTKPYQALIKFYYAFNNRNMDVMSKNWH